MAKKELRTYDINIYSLKDQAYDYEYELRDSFFDSFENSLTEKGELNVKVVITKSATHINADFSIDGWVQLICDRSLDSFKLDIAVRDTIIFKFGDHYEELDDILISIPYDAEKLNLAQYIYELILLQIPIKKLAPQFEEDDSDEENDEDILIYTSTHETDEEDKPSLDPRWAGLDKFKN